MSQKAVAELSEALYRLRTAAGGLLCRMETDVRAKVDLDVAVWAECAAELSLEIEKARATQDAVTAPRTIISDHLAKEYHRVTAAMIEFIHREAQPNGCGPAALARLYRAAADFAAALEEYP